MAKNSPSTKSDITLTPEEINRRRNLSEKQLDHIMTLSLQQEPFWASILGFLDRIQDTNIPIAAVSFDKDRLVYRFHYNPITFYQVSNEEAVEVIKHELMHIVFGHLLDDKMIENRTLWNIATDMCINPYTKLPRVLRLTEDKIDMELVYPPNGWKSHQTSVYYFIRLFNQDKCTCGNGEGNDDKSKGNKSSCPVHGDKEILDSHKYWSTIQKNNQKRVAEEMRNALVKESYLKSRGNVPAGIDEIIKSIISGDDIPWQRIVQGAVSEEITDDFREVFCRRDRRKRDLISSIPGKVRENAVNLYVAIDSSGSVGDQEYSELLGVTEKIKEKTNANITMLYFSCEIKKIEPFSKRDKYKRYDRGGTAFAPVLEYVKKQKAPNKMLLVLTDGYGENPDGRSYNGFKTIWVINNKEAVPANFGRIIRTK